VVAASQTPFIVVLAQSLKGGVPQCLGNKKHAAACKMHSTFLVEFVILRAQPPTPQDFKC
jgi:hypothetical protein